MDKPNRRQFISGGGWLRKVIKVQGQVARKQAGLALASMIDFRRYPLALLADTTAYMDVSEADITLGNAALDKVQHQQACLAAFVQGADWTEALILEAQYIKAAAALKQDFELLTRIREVEAERAAPDRTPNVRHAPLGSQRFYGLLNAIAHPSNLDNMLALLSYTSTPHLSIGPIFRDQVSKDMYSLHIWLCLQMSLESLGILISLLGEDHDDVIESASWLSLLAEKAEGLFVYSNPSGES